MPELKKTELSFARVQDKISESYIMSILRMNRARCVNFILFGNQDGEEVKILKNQV